MTQPLQYNNFVNGLITDYNETNFPENALSKAINIEIKTDGSIARRKGLKQISDNSIASGSDIVATEAIRAKDSNLLVVVLASNIIEVYDIDADFVLAYTFQLYEPNAVLKASITSNSKAVYIAIEADTTVTPNAAMFYYISIANDGSLSSPQRYRLKIRDLKGTLPPSDTRPTTLTADHKYNLYNQGWFQTVKNYDDGASGTDVHFFKNDIGVYPSLVDDPALGVAVNASASDETRFRAINITGEAYSDLIPSAKGKVIFYPFLPAYISEPMDLSDTAKPTKNEIDTYLVSKGYIVSSSRGADAIEAFASRIFYAGFTGHKKFAGTVFYSKVIENLEDAGVCHQEGDPTSTNASEPLDTDGGYIVIPEAGDIFELKAVGKFLYVFATNGVWVIYGDPSSGGFTNLNYSVFRITSIPAYNKLAISEIEDTLVYVGVGGVYALTEDKATGYPVANSIIKGKLDNWFRNLTEAERQTSSVFFDKEAKLAYFIFNKTKVLVMNLNFGAFYELQLQEPIDFAIQLPYLKVYDIVESNNGYPLPSVADRVPYSLIFLSNGIPCQFVNPRYFDINESNGVYTSEFTIGPFNFKDLYRTKQVFRVISQFKRTETISHTDSNGDIILEDESSCFMRAIWDYSSSTSTGKVGSWIQTYTSPRWVSFEPTGTYEYDVHQTKRRLRGSGKALKLEFKSEGNKHFNLLSYILEVQGRPRG